MVPARSSHRLALAPSQDGVVLRGNAGRVAGPAPYPSLFMLGFNIPASRDAFQVRPSPVGGCEVVLTGLLPLSYPKRQ